MDDYSRSTCSTILVLICSWSLVIFVCLNGVTDDPGQFHQVETLGWISRLTTNQRSNLNPGFLVSKPPGLPKFMRYFQLNLQDYREIDVLYYQFNPLDFNNTYIDKTSISKVEHEKLALSSSSTSGQIDIHIKSEGYKLFAFNVLGSNKIGVFRQIPDTRQPKCLTYLRRYSDRISGAVHSSQEPIDQIQDENSTPLKASIIICYYNEAPSALLRTIKTILVRSPPSLVQEIIVVDDFSEAGYRSEDLKVFVRSDLVKFLRTEQREGLIRARLLGSSVARGNVLIFLDSHIEANVGWLEPLMATIAADKHVIACPMIDLINADTLIYSASPMVKGGLNWSLNFKWDSVPSAMLKSYDDFIKPIESPTMAGGLFAIHKDFFNRLGSYDSAMDLWGGENIELSLRTWMCGGRILIIPCSRLGHIFRKKRPYGPAAGQPDSLLTNSYRAALVWLDDYIDKFYDANPEARNLGRVDVSDRLELRKRLRCNNFRWYLDNVYPDLKDDSSGSRSDIASAQHTQRPNLFKFANRKAFITNAQ